MRCDSLIWITNVAEVVLDVQEGELAFLRGEVNSLTLKLKNVGHKAANHSKLRVLWSKLKQCFLI